MDRDHWPALPLAEWEPTYLTLHRWTQIAGKLRLALEPYLNHWWQVPLYVGSRGLTTGGMPCAGRMLTVTFDFRDHRLCFDASDGRSDGFALEPMTVAAFYARFLESLRKLDVRAHIWPVPVEVVDRTPFPDDRQHASYDPRWARALHRVLLSVDPLFRRHRGRFRGKASPVHFFWGAFDLAVTRFSGRANPNPPADPLNAEAYSHELVSHGFWPGGDVVGRGRVDEPVFYAYAVPEPPGFAAARVRPDAARYSHAFGEFFLPYEAVRTAADPEATLLEFMDATYLAAGWGPPVSAAERPAPIAPAANRI